MEWRIYHDSTKHSPESLRRSRHVLDWANMPDPFRHYSGVPVLDLPADPPAPEVPALELLAGKPSLAPAAVEGSLFLSQLLFYSASISASKSVPTTGYRYALRVNPSSGNLHPTEFHFLARGLSGWPDGIFHYRPSSHMVEQRAAGVFHLKPGRDAAPLVFVLTSIAWREAWKYRERAYRYCLLDIGHAWQALALAARALGCEPFAIGHFPDDEAAGCLRAHGDEWPMLIVELRGAALRVREPQPHAGGTEWYGGAANRLSEETVEYPSIAAIHRATGLNARAGWSIPFDSRPDEPCGGIALPAPAVSDRRFGEVVRSRRSALDFVGGTGSMSLAQLSAILRAATQASSADFGGCGYIRLCVYVHRVAGLEPGVYWYRPESAELEPIRRGDQRVIAAGLSLGQDLAGNACVALTMAGDFERAGRVHGDRGYRYVHFEAGAIGHRMYLAAEALGLRATGIGAFYDDEVHRYLGLTTAQGRQAVYHFAIGYPVPDGRLDG